MNTACPSKSSGFPTSSINRELYDQLPLPEERSWKDFRDAFAKLHDASLVHDLR